MTVMEGWYDTHVRFQKILAHGPKFGKAMKSFLSDQNGTRNSIGLLHWYDWTLLALIHWRKVSSSFNNGFTCKLEQFRNMWRFLMFSMCLLMMLISIKLNQYTMSLFFHSVLNRAKNDYLILKLTYMDTFMYYITIRSNSMKCMLSQACSYGFNLGSSVLNWKINAVRNRTRVTYLNFNKVSDYSTCQINGSQPEYIELLYSTYSTVLQRLNPHSTSKELVLVLEDCNILY